MSDHPLSAFAKETRLGAPSVASIYAEAVRLHASGKAADAERLCQELLAAVPDHADGLHLLGILQFESGRRERAVELVSRAAELNPHEPVFHKNLGNMLGRLGRHAEARTEYERALALQPRSAPLSNDLALVLEKLGLEREAIAAYERAVALKPDYAAAWANLAAAYRRERRYSEALSCCDRALALGLDDAETHNSRGMALVALDRFDEALASYERALAFDPKFVEAYGNIASALIERGRIDEAVVYLRKALALEGRRTALHLFHILAAPASEGDPRIAALETLAHDPAVSSDADVINLRFALAQAYTDVGRYDDAFTQLLAGNALVRKGLEYEEATMLARFRRIELASSAQVIEGWRGMGNPSERPIFILGMPRTGSTLVEQILASHPQVAAGGELTCLYGALAAVLGPSEDFLPAATAPDERRDLLARIAAHYLEALGAVAPDALRVTDKMPSNFPFVGLIHLALPNARIIHTRRDPIDTCLSCFSTLFAGGVPFSYDLGEIGRYYRAYDRLMRHWRDVLPEGAFLEVDYEDVVRDIEGQAKRLVAYCGLPWNDACLAFHKARRPVKTASALQVRRPLYGTAVGRWRELDPGRLRPLTEELGDISRARLS